VAAFFAASRPAAADDAAREPLAAARPRVALTWVDPDALAGRRAPSDLGAASSTYVPVLPELLPAKRRSPKGALVSVGIAAVLVGGYAAATLAWPLDSVRPTVTTADAPSVTAPASEISWPDDGVSAVGVDGVTTTAASSEGTEAIASITKLVSVMMVLDRDPFDAGSQGDEHEISYDDRVDYWNFLGRGESAIDVPVGSTLSDYQLMQGALIASAGNYTAKLTREFWPTDESFASAADEWLSENGLDGITVVEPTGIDRGNSADPASLVRLAELAMDDPVIADIVSTESVEIPGVGTIENTNPLLGEDGVVGLKTGGLVGTYNLLAAEEVAVDDTTVRVYAAVLGQPTEALRESATADVLAQVAEEASQRQTLAAGTSVGTVTTPWETSSDVVTAADVSVLLWNEATATAETAIELGDASSAGDTVGELRLAGPLDSAATELTMTGDLGEPDAWWRLTHPLELFGLAG
jgi:D-alanyl-D-alanine carboxypeptidase (penicillin-binding protein 5/6)